MIIIIKCYLFLLFLFISVDCDEEQQKNYAILKGEDVAEMTVQQIREYNTGTNVYLTGRITPVNAMEDLTIDFTM